MGMPGMMSDDGTRYYDADLTYATSNGVWKPYALNMDGFSGSDPQMAADQFDFGNGTRRTQEREVAGHRLLAQSGANVGYLRVYRFDGELRRICKSFAGAHDQTLAPNGDVWIANGQVTRYQRTGWDASGCPIYDSGTTVPPAPGVSDAYRLAVDGTTIYVMGYDSSCPFESGFDDWKFAGKCLARFDGLPTSSGWSARAWKINVPWNTYPDRPVSMDAAGSRVAVAYLSTASTNQGHVRIFNSSNGSFISDLVPDKSIFGPEPGWDDMFDALTVKNGLISVQANGQDKTILITPQ
jgi:hypothetical protein